jgi:hypothetical protein
MRLWKEKRKLGERQKINLWQLSSPVIASSTTRKSLTYE